MKKKAREMRRMGNGDAVARSRNSKRAGNKRDEEKCKYYYFYYSRSSRRKMLMTYGEVVGGRKGRARWRQTVDWL